MDWKRKLASRKFWESIAGFITGLIVFIQSAPSTPEKITGLIMSFGSVVAYIVGEGLADAAGAGKDEYTYIEGEPSEEVKPDVD